MRATRSLLLAAAMSAGHLFVHSANAASLYLSNTGFGSGTLDVAAQWESNPALGNFTDATLNFSLTIDIDASMYVSTTGPSTYTYWGQIFPESTVTRYNPELNASYPYYARRYDGTVFNNYYNPTQTNATASVGAVTSNASNNLLPGPVQFGNTTGSSQYTYKYHVVSDPDGPLGAKNSGPVPSWARDYDVYDIHLTRVQQSLSGYSNIIDFSVDLDAAALDILNTSGTVSYLLSAIGGNASAIQTRLDYSYASAPLATVPVPPAIWLFGSGLLSLLGIGARKAA